MIQDKVYQAPVIFKKVVTSEREDQSGYQEIYSSGTNPFAASEVPALTTGTYNLRVTINSTLRSLALSIVDTDTFDAIATKIQTAIRALTSSTETCVIVNKKFRITSATNGPSSTVLIQDGVTDGLLAALTALLPSGKYVPVISAAVPGTEGIVTIQVAPNAPTEKDFHFVAFCIDSANKEKTGLKYTYDKTTGLVSVADDADVVEVKNGDVITLVGVFS